MTIAPLTVPISIKRGGVWGGSTAVPVPTSMVFTRTMRNIAHHTLHGMNGIAGVP